MADAQVIREEAKVWFEDFIHNDVQKVPNKGNVEVEQMLEKARSGEIRSVAVVGVKPNHHVFSCWHSEGQYYTLTGGLSWLSHRMNSGDS